nr:MULTISPECIES: hypothetical protein [unclassified Streptomyces]
MLRTAGLIAVAAVLGLVGGTAVGYGVQAGRPPVALPALSQPGLAYPAKPLPAGQEAEELSAKEDLRSKTDGDLRKLLLPRPPGARADGQDGWMPLDAYANSFTLPDSALKFQLDQKVRRIAARAWYEGENKWVRIELAQYHSASWMGAFEHVRDQQRNASLEDEADSIGDPVKGSSHGRYYVFPVEREPGYLDLYQARAFIQRGDIAVTVLISDTRKISGNEIRSLAERQLGRL